MSRKSFKSKMHMGSVIDHSEHSESSGEFGTIAIYGIGSSIGLRLHHRCHDGKVVA